MKEILKKSTGNKIRIAIVDSGINLSHSLLQNINISNKSFSILSKNANCISKDINDEFGHGTAILGILAKFIPDAEFIIVKIFDDANLRADENKLIMALKQLIENIECDIIHMSLGIVIPSHELECLCKSAYDKGIVMVSAYDNAGAISYPANYREVIGVDSDNRCIRADDFMLIEGDNTTILAKGGNHRLAWIDPEYIISQGSSFSAAYVTAYIAKMLSLKIDKQDIINTFKKISMKSIKIENQEAPNLTKIPFDIKNAAIFPYNKEMHSLINYAEYLPFNIKMICDSKYTGRVGKKIQSLNKKNQYIISNINNICWNEIDTLILGHLNELESSIGKQIKKELLILCALHNVNIYAFDDVVSEYNLHQLAEQNIKVYTPQIKDILYLKQYMGKMFQFNKPVVGVFGTSAKQGKFTLQLSMRYTLMSMGYTIGQIGTEPSALLFGLDACYPFGYNSTVRLRESESILAINHLLHEVEIKHEDADLIIVGSQSGTAPMLYNNIGQMTSMQLSFLMGILPDVVVLCISADDEIDVIIRNIQAIEGVGNTKVVALALYPLAYINGWHLMNNQRNNVTNIEDIKCSLNILIKKPIFVIGDDDDVQRLCELLIETLSAEDD